ncbi:MAG: dihydrodipicolinate synthase family protein [Eubacteriales bacterium]
MEAVNGIYPTMITPYDKEGKVDYEAVRRLVDWYWKEGCDGIFASCLSSEIFHLSLEDRVGLVREVMAESRRLAKNDKSREPMMIVASGHISDSFEDQVNELRAVAAEQPDALVLITNRMDIENTSDEKWIADAERLIATLPSDLPLGIYECPTPYARYLSEKMTKWCARSGRFYFIKDTCSNAKAISEKIKWCEKTPLKLYNANTRTLLESLRDGAAGFCGIMANFHPSLYSKLYHSDWYSEEAKELQEFLTKAESELRCYPASAKYFLSEYENIPMEITCRMGDHTKLVGEDKNSVINMIKEAELMKNKFGV